MTDRVHLFDHTITLDRDGRYWRARIYRARFDGDGVVVGCVKIAELRAWTKAGATRRARAVIRSARNRRARWPRQFGR